MRMRVLFAIVLAAGLTLAAGAARAHPHVWVTVTSEILYAADGTVTGVRHAWTFDSTFSANTLRGLQATTGGAYPREQLAGLAKAQVELWKEKAYFTFVKDNGKLPFAEPTDCLFDYNDDRLTLHFTLPLRTPGKSKAVLLEIVDRSFFIDFDFAKDNPVKLVGAPAGCEVRLKPTMGNDRDRKMVQDASEDSFKEGGANVAVGLLFDNAASVYCR